MILCLSFPYRERNFGFHFNVSRFHRSIFYGDCDVCYLFRRENLASLYKCRNVELICSACVKRVKSKKYHMDATSSPETNIYLSGAHVSVDGI